MIFTIYDSAGAYPVGVTANNQLMVNLPTVAAQAGLAGIVDAQGHRLSFDDEGRIDSAISTSLFFDPIDGTTLDPNRWTQALTGAMTIAQTAGFIVLNSGSITTAGAAAQIQTMQRFDIMHEAYLYGHVQMLVDRAPQTNQTAELGFGLTSGITAPTDAAIFRWSTDGTFRCVLNNTGSETQISGALTAPTINVVHHFEVKIINGEVVFLLDEVVISTLAAAAGVANVTGVARLPAYARIVNGTTPAAAMQMKIAALDIWRTVLDVGLMGRDFQTSLGRGAMQDPVTWAQTANHANNTSPTSATLSNTAAGYTTLGGRWQFAAPVGAATDFALFGYQVPVGWDLNVHDVQITTVNTGAAVATTATILDWFIAVDSTAVSLATTDTLPGTVAPRRQPIGVQGFAVAAGIGAIGNTLAPHWEAALCCGGGRWFHIGVQVPIGTATASQVVRGDAFVAGYFF